MWKPSSISDYTLKPRSYRTLWDWLLKLCRTGAAGGRAGCDHQSILVIAKVSSERQAQGLLVKGLITPRNRSNMAAPGGCRIVSQPWNSRHLRNDRLSAHRLYSEQKLRPDLTGVVRLLLAKQHSRPVLKIDWARKIVFYWLWESRRLLLTPVIKVIISAVKKQTFSFIWLLAVGNGYFQMPVLTGHAEVEVCISWYYTSLWQRETMRLDGPRTTTDWSGKSSLWSVMCVCFC